MAAGEGRSSWGCLPLTIIEIIAVFLLFLKISGSLGLSWWIIIALLVAPIIIPVLYYLIRSSIFGGGNR